MDFSQESSIVFALVRGPKLVVVLVRDTQFIIALVRNPHNSTWHDFSEATPDFFMAYDNRNLDGGSHEIQGAEMREARSQCMPYFVPSISF